MKKLYILGSGVSVDCGIPVLWNMAKAIESEYRLSTITEGLLDIDPNTVENYHTFRKPLADTLKKIIERHPLLISNFDKGYNKLSTENKRILRILYFWYFWDRRNHSPSDPNRGFNFESSRALRLLVGKINTTAKNDSVVSFNYDFMLEEAFSYDNGYSFGYDYCLSNNINKIKIVKPLGSANWVVLSRKEVEQVQQKPGESSVLREISIIDKDFCLYETRVFHQEFDKVVFKPSIYDKKPIYKQNKLIEQTLWLKANQLLEEADRVIVIGYDLRKMNRGVIASIRSFAKKVLDKDNLIIVNPDDDSDSLMNFVDYIRFNYNKKAKAIFHKKTFANWIAEEYESDLK